MAIADEDFSLGVFSRSLQKKKKQTKNSHTAVFLILFQISIKHDITAMLTSFGEF